MKDLRLLVFLTQFGISVAAPLAGFVLLAVWLQKTFHWDTWVIFVGVALGAVCAVDGFRSCLAIMERMSREKNEEEPPVSFNEHD